MLKRTSRGMLSHFGNSSMHIRKYTDKDILIMKNRRLSGETWDSIAKDYNVHRATVCRLVANFNPIIDNRVIPKGFIPMSVFCDHNGIPYETAIYHCRKKNVNVLKKGNRIYIHRDTIFENKKFISQDKIDRINELSKLGYTKTDIAKEIGISRYTVASYLKLEII